jgi:hypothetical protein
VPTLRRACNKTTASAGTWVDSIDPTEEARMRGFSTGDDLERRLRAQRPRPRDGFVEALSVHVREARTARRRRPVRVAFAGAVTFGLLAALASVGGLGYAANAAKTAAVAVFQVSPATGPAAVSAGGDQYRPGYGWGDKNHNHTGPPGLRRRGSLTPIPQARRTPTGGWLVSTAVNVDEQADLFVSVIGPSGKAAVLSQNRSRIGGGVSGPPTTAIRYRVLVPRTIPIALNIPRGQLVAGTVYRIKIVARDPNGNASTMYVRFRA